ncbi:MAG: glycosyltransferase family 2 protein [Chitinophagales bacterium]|nr:glycosyltransferase family 2 protein [Bacteroidota bacterium]MCB9255746.1 glycosyltransferase family 2 protein [Chitinophagales bacterium]
MKRNKISIAIITKNAEKHLNKVLDAAKLLSDDIIVLDSYSTDKTQEIAQSYELKFLAATFKSYGNQKNLANSMAKYDWILSIDADEVLSQALIQEILELELKTSKVYSIPFQNMYCGKLIRFGRWKNEKHVRLFEKDKVKWNESEVHESLDYDKRNILFLKSPILHYSMDSKAIHLDKAKKYSKIGAEVLKSKKKKSSIIKLYLNPVFRFVKDYFFSLGFLDGKLGFQIAWIIAKETYWKYKRLKEIS